MARLRYSDRKLMAEVGKLGDLSHDTVSDELATAMRALIESANRWVIERFLADLSAACTQHFGITQPWHAYVTAGPAEAFLDFTEIAAEEANREARPLRRALHLCAALKGPCSVVAHLK